MSYFDGMGRFAQVSSMQNVLRLCCFFKVSVAVIVSFLNSFLFRRDNVFYLLEKSKE